MEKVRQSPPLEDIVDRRTFLNVASAAVAAAAAPLAASQPAAAQAITPASGMTSTVRLDKPTPQLWQVTIANPPFNLVVPQMVSELHDVVKEMDDDRQVKVLVIKSAIDGYFINHFDLAKAAEFPVLDTKRETPTWTDLVLRLSKSPVISIAIIRGRTRGGGNEFSLACDLRYASREGAYFGQPEVGAGIVPGGGGSERLPRLVGRDRALEIILSSQDYGAEEAERFGLVTRALPDAALDTHVEGLVRRLCGFDKQALAAAKAQVNRAALPPDEDLLAAYSEYSASLAWPGFQARRPNMAKLVAEHGAAEIELRLGHYLGLANSP